MRCDWSAQSASCWGVWQLVHTDSITHSGQVSPKPKMFVALGAWTCCSPGPWQVSQPTPSLRKVSGGIPAV